MVCLQFPIRGAILSTYCTTMAAHLQSLHALDDRSPVKLKESTKVLCASPSWRANIAYLETLARKAIVHSSSRLAAMTCPLDDAHPEQPTGPEVVVLTLLNSKWNCLVVV